MKNYLITWFYAESEDDESYYPQVGGESSSTRFQEYYWKCVYVFYRSAIAANRDNSSIEYMFFTNVFELDFSIGAINFKQFFEENNIEVRHLGLSKKLPKDWWGAWRNQMYVFDILKNLKSLDGSFLILDSDCVIRRDLNPLFADISNNGALRYVMSGSNEALVNGCSRQQMGEIYRSIYGGDTSVVEYCGGEIIAITHESLLSLLLEFEYLWEKNYDRYLRGETKLIEEAHYLSCLYRRIGVVNSIASQYIRRIWTTLKYDNVAPSDAGLFIWHLPGEKKAGFPLLFDRFSSCINLDDIEVLHEIESVFSIVRAKPLRMARKVLFEIRNRVLLAADGAFGIK